MVAPDRFREPPGNGTPNGQSLRLFVRSNCFRRDEEFAICRQENIFGKIRTMIEHPGLFFGFLASVFAVVVDGLGKRFRRRRFAISLFGAVVFSAAGATMSFTYLDTGTPVGFEHTLFCLFVSLLGFLFSVDVVVHGRKQHFAVKISIVLISLSPTSFFSRLGWCREYIVP